MAINIDNELNSNKFVAGKEDKKALSTSRAQTFANYLRNKTLADRRVLMTEFSAVTEETTSAAFPAGTITCQEAELEFIKKLRETALRTGEYDAFIGWLNEGIKNKETMIEDVRKIGVDEWISSFYPEKVDPCNKTVVWAKEVKGLDEEDCDFLGSYIYGNINNDISNWSKKHGIQISEFPDEKPTRPEPICRNVEELAKKYLGIGNTMLSDDNQEEKSGYTFSYPEWLSVSERIHRLVPICGSNKGTMIVAQDKLSKIRVNPITTEGDGPYKEVKKYTSKINEDELLDVIKEASAELNSLQSIRNDMERRLLQKEESRFTNESDKYRIAMDNYDTACRKHRTEVIAATKAMNEWGSSLVGEHDTYIDHLRTEWTTWKEKAITKINKSRIAIPDMFKKVYDEIEDGLSKKGGNNEETETKA